MLVSYDHKLIFLKTRKTASTSVEMFLQSVCGLTDGPVAEKTPAIKNSKGVVGRRLVGRNNSALGQIWYNHMPASEVRAQLGQGLWNECTKVTTVRDPFDRMLSGYFWRRAQRPDVPKSHDEIKIDLEQFVRDKELPDDRSLFFSDGEFIVDHSIRYEDLRAQLQEFCSQKNLDTSGVELPHTKALGHKRHGLPVAEFFTPTAVSMIQDEYDWMFDRFGYAKTPEER